MHRTASHAGSWYEGSGSRLTRKLDDWLDKADVEVDSNLKAIIAPHAGYYFCGSCAAHAYKKIDPQGIKRIFIMGPSHHVHYSNCVLSAAKVGDVFLDFDVFSFIAHTNFSIYKGF